MRLEAGQKSSRLRLRGGALSKGLDPSRHERSEQKRPHRTLMIGFVAFPDASCIARTIAAVVRRECAQSDWREELGFDQSKDLPRPIERDQSIDE